MQSGEDRLEWRLLVFGASGAIGRVICEEALGRKWRVTAVSRTDRGVGDKPRWLKYDPASDEFDQSGIGGAGPYDAVCWAQGANMADSVLAFDEPASARLYETNCLFVARTMHGLARTGALAASGARLCVVSSIWQERARQGKLSYCMTKAALGGLVRSASVDLGEQGHLVNAVLPGVLDTPMTRGALTPDQLRGVENATPAGRLANPEAIASLVCFLCSRENTAISGQSLTADLGFSNARIV